MLKCHSELFKSSVKLADGLRLSTKEELKDIAQLLLLPVPSKLRKEEYVSCLAEAVLTCPDIWISQLTHYEWLLLQKLVKAGANTYVEEPNMIMTSTLELLSFVAVECSLNGDKIRYMIVMSCVKRLLPILISFDIDGREQPFCAGAVCFRNFKSLWALTLYRIFEATDRILEGLNDRGRNC